MPVLDFECQLARSQISRYMGGEILSEDLLGQLKGHVDECAGCRLFLQERRDALRQMMDLGEPGPKPAEHRAGYAVVHTNRTELHSDPENQPSKAEALLSQIKARTNPNRAATAPSDSDAPNKHVKNGFSKPALYSIGLAGVLIVMSYMVKSPNGLLGPKAIASFTGSSSSQNSSAGTDSKSTPGQAPGSSPSSKVSSKPTDAASANAAGSSAKPKLDSQPTSGAASATAGAGANPNSTAEKTTSRQTAPPTGGSSTSPVHTSATAIGTAAKTSQPRGLNIHSHPHSTGQTHPAKSHGATHAAKTHRRSKAIFTRRPHHRLARKSGSSGVRVYANSN